MPDITIELHPYEDQNGGEHHHTEQAEPVETALNQENTTPDDSTPTSPGVQTGIGAMEDN